MSYAEELAAAALGGVAKIVNTEIPALKLAGTAASTQITQLQTDALALKNSSLFEVVAGTHAGYPDKGHSAIADALRASIRVPHIIATDIEEIAFVIGTSGKATSGYTAHGIIYDNLGNKYPITSNGSASIRVDALGIVKTDFIKLKLKKDTTIHSVWCLDLDVAGSAPAYIWLNQENGSGIGKNQDWTLTGVLPTFATTPSDTTTSNGYGYSPIAVLGKTVRQNVVSLDLIGDSILDGVGENQPTYSSSIRTRMANGYIERGLKNLIGFSNWGVSNEFLNQFTPTPNAEWVYRKRLFDFIPFNAAIIEYPINDIKSGAAITAIRTNMNALITFLKSKGVNTIFLCTVTPVTTSTDTWATTANQTVTSAEAVRVQHNTDVRTGYYDVSGYFEAADKAETARNSGIWPAGYTQDGIHPISVCINEMMKAVSPDAIKQSLLMIN